MIATMDQTRQAAILFADVSDSTKLYESEGDRAAMQAIALCIEHLRRSAEASGGRVVKTIGDAIMAVFPTPDAAAVAAGRMQHAIDALEPVGTNKLGVRIGFHSGAVIQSGSDLFGDTVNLAARLVEQAGKGQILTSHETSEKLGPAFRSFKRPLYDIHVKGKTEEVRLCELIWRQAEDMTLSFARRMIDKAAPLVLRLKYLDREVVCRRHDDAITLGRDPACGVVVASSRASRHHCSIERRQDKFVLTDQSTNGTYVTAEGAAEIFLQRETFLLTGHGRIALGQTQAEAEGVVEYFCD